METDIDFREVNNSKFFDWILLMVLAVIWGSSFYAVSLSLISFQPTQIAAGRIVIGAVVLLAFCFRYNGGIHIFVKGERKTWFYSFGMGAFTNAIPFSLLGLAQTELMSSFVGITMSCVPFITLVLAHFFVVGEKLSYQKVSGLIVGFIGVVILFDLFEIINQWHVYNNLRFKLACLGAAICYSIGSIITRRSPEVSRLNFSASGLLAGSIIILPITFFADGVPKHFDFISFLALVYLGLIPTALATLLLVNLIKRVGPTFLSFVNYLVPLWAIIFGVFLNSEILEATFFFGAVFIFTGLTLSQGKTR